jgi:broad specificity phosphatase PhoE
MKRRQSQKDKELADNARLLRAWKQFHREERDAVLAGPHSATLGELFRMFANLKHVQRAQIHEINAAIVKLRMTHGLVPIDDNLPDEPDTPFRTIKAIALAPSPHHEGAHRGAARIE